MLTMSAASWRQYHCLCKCCCLIQRSDNQYFLHLVSGSTPFPMARSEVRATRTAAWVRQEHGHGFSLVSCWDLVPSSHPFGSSLLLTCSAVQRSPIPESVSSSRMPSSLVDHFSSNSDGQRICGIETDPYSCPFAPHL